VTTKVVPLPSSPCVARPAVVHLRYWAQRFLSGDRVRPLSPGHQHDILENTALTSARALSTVCVVLLEIWELCID